MFPRVGLMTHPFPQILSQFHSGLSPLSEGRRPYCFSSKRQLAASIQFPDRCLAPARRQRIARIVLLHPVRDFGGNAGVSGVVSAASNSNDNRFIVVSRTGMRRGC
jgi:hypothetical protein